MPEKSRIFTGLVTTGTVGSKLTKVIRKQETVVYIYGISTGGANVHNLYIGVC